MGLDWGRALASGAEAGLNAESGLMKQDQDDARWLAREKQLDTMRKDDRIETERFLLGLKPPETRKLNVAGKGGPAIQQQEWVPPAAGEDKGHFQNVGDETPDINFERLDETAKHNRETEELTGARNAATAEASAARIDLARTKLEAAQSKKNGTETQPKPYTFTVDGKPTVRYGSFINGKFQPAVDENGLPVQGEKFKPSVFEEKLTAARDAKAAGAAKKANAEDDASRVPAGFWDRMTHPGDPAYSEPAAGPPASMAGDPNAAPAGTMPNLKPRPQKAPTSTPASARGVAPATSSHGAVVKLGTDAQGRRVAKYADGFVGPAP